MFLNTYSLTDDGRIIRDDIHKEGKFQSWQEGLGRINSQPLANDFNQLSIAAKVHYIVNARGGATTEQVRQIALRKGYTQITENDFKLITESPS